MNSYDILCLGWKHFLSTLEALQTIGILNEPPSTIVTTGIDHIRHPVHKPTNPAHIGFRIVNFPIATTVMVKIEQKWLILFHLYKWSSI